MATLSVACTAACTEDAASNPGSADTGAEAGPGASGRDASTPAHSTSARPSAGQTSKPPAASTKPDGGNTPEAGILPSASASSSEVDSGPLATSAASTSAQAPLLESGIDPNTPDGGPETGPSIDVDSGDTGVDDRDTGVTDGDAGDAPAPLVCEDLPVPPSVPDAGNLADAGPSPCMPWCIRALEQRCPTTSTCCWESPDVSTFNSYFDNGVSLTTVTSNGFDVRTDVWKSGASGQACYSVDYVQTGYNEEFTWKDSCGQIIATGTYISSMLWVTCVGDAEPSPVDLQLVDTDACENYDTSGGPYAGAGGCGLGCNQ